jgi:bifunctional DNase/RNase
MSDPPMAPAELPLSSESEADPELGTGPVAGRPDEVASTAATDVTDDVETSDPPDVTGATDAAPSTTPAPVSGDYRMALVTAVTVDLPNPHPTVVLRESESPRRQLSFSIAMPDAIVLSHALRRIATPRPLTHELVTGILQKFDIDVVAVRLVGRQGSVYFAELDLRGRTGRSVHSCRPSDALTLALQQAVPVPILIDRRLFEQVGDVAPPGPSS